MQRIPSLLCHYKGISVGQQKALDHVLTVNHYGALKDRQITIELHVDVYSVVRQQQFQLPNVLIVDYPHDFLHAHLANGGSPHSLLVKDSIDFARIVSKVEG